jgi:mono/diheme cytochrome c family protein
MLVMNKTSILSVAFLAIAVVAVMSSCNDKRSRGLEFAPNMYEPLAYNPDQKNPIFSNGITAQLPPDGTTPIGYVRFEYPNTLEGYNAASAGAVNPLEATQENILEGKQLYISMCGPCHGDSGKGNGHIVELGKFPAPPSFATGNSSRGGLMKDLTGGKIYHTIEYGLNLMGSYASQLSPEERWKVVMYVHELQNAQ